MKREIRFRGLRTDGKGWVHGDLFDTTSSEVCNFLPTIIENGGASRDSFHLVFPSSIGQFTGLRDKNGVELYEGDRIRHNKNTYVIKFSENQHCLLLRVEKDKGMNWRSLQWLANTIKYCELIGNVHGK